MSIQEDIKKYIDQASGQLNVGKEKLEGLVSSLALDEKKAQLDGIISSLKEKGLKDTVASWVGTGENQPINPEKIKEALGVHRIEELAAQAKMKASEVPQALSNLLPQIIDKLTPDGKEPENGIAAAAVKFLRGLQTK
ncbi:MAG: YidB family protein [Turneriella sp.]